MKITLLSSLLLLSVLLCFGCVDKTKQKPKSCKQLYEEYLPKNIERCVQAQVEGGVDSTSAYEQCKYALEKAYELDSTFVKMDGEQRALFFSEHKDELFIK